MKTLPAVIPEMRSKEFAADHASKCGSSPDGVSSSPASKASTWDALSHTADISMTLSVMIDLVSEPITGEG